MPYSSALWGGWGKQHFTAWVRREEPHLFYSIEWFKTDPALIIMNFCSVFYDLILCRRI